jgi:hypothetical protein
MPYTAGIAVHLPPPYVLPCFLPYTILSQFIVFLSVRDWADERRESVGDSQRFGGGTVRA